MIALLAALAISAAAPTASAAQSGVAFANFRNFCVDHDGAAAQALAAADAQGWMSLNKSLVPIPPGSTFTFDDYELRMKADGTSMSMLLAGRGSAHSSGESIPGSICMTISKPLDEGALGMAKAWLGMEPLGSQGNMQIYAYENTPNGGRAFIKPTADLKERMHDGRVKLVITAKQPSDDLTLFGYFTGKK